MQIKYTETVLPTVGFVTDEQGRQAMSSVRLAAACASSTASSPTLLLKAMDNPKDVRPIGNQRIGRQSYRAVSFTDGGTKFIILFDPKTHLPAAIRTLDDDNIHGDPPSTPCSATGRPSAASRLRTRCPIRSTASRSRR